MILLIIRISSLIRKNFISFLKIFAMKLVIMNYKNYLVLGIHQQMRGISWAKLFSIISILNGLRSLKAKSMSKLFQIVN
jgi:hypothetical protein